MEGTGWGNAGPPVRLPGGAARGAPGLWRLRRLWRTWARRLYAAGGRAASGTDGLATAVLPLPQRPARVYTGGPRWGHLSAAARPAPVVLVGHSCGGAVVIAAGVVHAQVPGVVACAPQTSGAQMAGQLAPHPLLVVPGKAATRPPTPVGCTWATGPRSRNSSSATTAPSTASTHVPQRSNSS